MRILRATQGVKLIEKQFVKNKYYKLLILPFTEAQPTPHISFYRLFAVY